MIYSEVSDFVIDESRRQFEAEFRKVYGTDPNIDLLLEQYNHGTDEDPDIGYYSLAARDAWQWWQASRQAIEITPPEPITTREALDAGYYGDYAAGRDDGIEDTLKVVRAAGLKIKGEP